MLTKKLVRMGIFTALCVVGAFLKIPSPTGTVSFDSAPGFFAAALLGGKEGALITALGHLISSGLTGFPLTLPIHLLIALQMAICAFLFAFLLKKANAFIAIITTIIANGVIAPLTLVPIYGMGFFVGMVLPLVIGSAANIIIAYLIYKAVKKAGVFNDQEDTRSNPY
ncbi:ECF transporter S component [Bacillota bacterium LX-D]|nr:ECF transporter S component [Bacillota bacterium LX-D]